MSRYQRQQPSSNDGLSPKAKQLLSGCLWFVIIVVLALAAYFTRSTWWPAVSGVFNHSTQVTQTTQQNQPQQQNQQPSNPAQPGQQPASAIPTTPLINTGPKQTIRLCFVTFDSYDLATVMPTFQNPNYNLVLYPLLFQAQENGPILTQGSESEQAAMITSGFCDILFTTRDALADHQSSVEVTTIDRSHGADQIWFSKTGRTPGCLGKPLKIINDLKGCKIAFTPDSVSQFYYDSILKPVAMTTSDITPVTSSNGTPFASPADAVTALNNNEADAVICWAGNCPDPKDGTVFLFSTSKDLSTIYDVILVSHQADQQKSDAVYYALGDWFTAVNKFLADPKGTAEIIANWKYTSEDGKNTYDTNWWTGINPGTAYDDMVTWGLDGIAMAKFDQNLVYLSNPELAWENLSLEREILEWSGLPHDSNFDPKKLTNFSYLQRLQKNRPDLYAPAGTQFLDNSFSPFPPDASTALSGSQATHVIAQFQCPNVFFGPDAVIIPIGSDQANNFAKCATTLKQIFDQSPGIRLQVIGSSAHPDPTRFGQKYAACGTQTDSDWCYKIAKGRAAWAVNALEAIGFSGNRIDVTYTIGDLTTDQSVMTDSRFITIQILAAGS